MGGKGFENKRHRETEPDLSRKGLRWKFPLGPGKTLLTILCICILALSLSADAAWLIGYQYMIWLLYIGAFSTTLMLAVDVSSLIDYRKNRKKISAEKEEPGADADMESAIRRLTLKRYGGKENVYRMPEEERDQLIRVYEKRYPEDREIIEKFFVKFQDKEEFDFSRDIQNIKYIIYSAGACYREIILKFLPYIRVEQFHKSLFAKNEYYNNYLNRIRIKLSDQKDLSKYPNPYAVFFHELSHAIDDVACTDIAVVHRYAVGEYKNDRGETLQDIARREAKAHVAGTIRQCIEKSGKKLTEEEQNRLLEDIFSPDTEKMTFSDPDAEFIYQAVRRLYGYSEHDPEQNKIFLHKGAVYPLHERKYGAVSDVLGGYTDNTVGACPVGHFTPFYWYNLLGKETRRQARELWAEYSAYLITGDQTAIRGTEQFFPESCAFIRDIWENKIT